MKSWSVIKENETTSYSNWQYARENKGDKINILFSDGNQKTQN